MKEGYAVVLGEIIRKRLLASCNFNFTYRLGIRTGWTFKNCSLAFYPGIERMRLSGTHTILNDMDPNIYRIRF